MNNRLKRIFSWSFLSVSIVLIILFLYVSNRLVRQLESEERAKIELWAEAYQKIIMADANAELAEQKIETIALFTKPELAHVSSSFVRDLASHGRDISPYLP